MTRRFSELPWIVGFAIAAAAAWLPIPAFGGWTAIVATLVIGAWLLFALFYAPPRRDRP